MLILLGTFFVLMLIGMPISFSLFTSSLFYLISNDIPLTVAVQRMIAGVDSFPLLAVPFFILAGAIMNSGGITKRLFAFANKVVGHLPGGLAHANILASIIFAGMSGSAVADAGGLGQIELEAMKEAGFDEDFSLAVTGASSIIGPIIPPSVPAVVFAVVAGVSIGRLFLAGVVPGLLMGLSLSVLVYIQSVKRNYPRGKRATLKELFIALKEAFFPLMTPAIILVGILTGIFTPTEAAIITVLYSLILGFAYKSITLRDLPQFIKQTSGTTMTIMFIISSASLFGWILASAQIPQLMSGYFVNFVSNKFLALIIINIFLLIVGTFMDNSAAIPILTPVLMPLAVQYGIDPVHFGLMVILNLMIGLATPPVGLVLYVLSSVSGVPFEKIAKALIPYLVILVIVLYIIAFIPAISLFLPNLVLGK